MKYSIEIEESPIFFIHFNMGKWLYFTFLGNRREIMEMQLEGSIL